MMPQPPITLGRHVIEEEHRHHPTTGELSRLLLQVAFMAKILAREISWAALVGQLGLVGEKNATGVLLFEKFVAEAKGAAQ